MEYNFLKYDLKKINHLNADYDTCSVMHYGAYAFSKVSLGFFPLKNPTFGAFLVTTPISNTFTFSYLNCT